MTDDPLRLAGLRDIAGRYDAFFCDVWGVIHDGLNAFEGAAEALVRYRQGGGRVICITNAPRTAPPIVSKLDRMGVPREAYDTIVSSGELARTLIAPFRGNVVHHVGPPTVDDTIYEGLGVTRGSAEDAQAVVVTDLDDDDDTPEMYIERMKLWRSRGLPLICANPDKVVEHGGRLVYCGGAIADLYAEMGGEVILAGKPYGPIYDEALKRAETAAGKSIPRNRILAIGDSVRTDATGAALVGVDFLFIAGLIHTSDLEAGTPVSTLVAPTGAKLVGWMPRLVW
jgi:HAD superfamily hydrolase (TIGR01459 family)